MFLQALLAGFNGSIGSGHITTASDHTPQVPDQKDRVAPVHAARAAATSRIATGRMPADHLLLAAHGTGRRVRMAVDMGALIAIGCDVHSPEDFDNLRSGVATGRRGWLRAEQCVNMWGAKRWHEWWRAKR